MVLAVVLSMPALLVAGVALIGCLAVFGVTFTRWGRQRKLTRYAAISVAAHLLLLLMASSVRHGHPAPGAEEAPPVRVRIVARDPQSETKAEPEQVELPTAAPEETPDETGSAKSLADQDIDEAVEEPVEQPNAVEVVEAPAERAETEPETSVAEQVATNSEAPVPLAEPKLAQPAVIAGSTPSEPIAARTDSLDSPPSPAPPSAIEQAFVEPIVSPPQETAPTPENATAPASVAAAAWKSKYATRGATQRRRLAEQDGGDAETEDAVARGVDWLARTQATNGSWEALRWGGGREQSEDKKDRGGAGSKAQTGLSGLALLALQGAGHTHMDGPYANTVTTGLAYLIDQQQRGGDRDGDLAGDALFYARTYCHSMATFALAEAYATTGDERLGPAVRRAAAFLERTQHPTFGGWRYSPGDRGDMSQMGWAVMALRSAELAGVAIQPRVWTGIERFLGSVAQGRSRGLACYRPGGGPTPTMTAEALYCRQILGVSRAQPAAGREAVALLASRLPAVTGRRRPNLYYWYYGTLALHHQREASPEAQQAWSRWNAAMKRAILPRQITDGPNAGSWRPDTLWGGYGGRVYTTALATMCLEVYYRYDADQIGRDPWLASRGASPSSDLRGGWWR